MTRTDRPILVAVDFSEASATALHVGGLLAMALDAPLVALHAEVLEAPAYFTHDQLDALEAQRQAARQAAVAYLDQFARARTNVHVEPRLVERPPVEAILEASREAMLVVMGTHGRKGPSLWWLGSVAERVVRASTVPVLVVRGAGADLAPSALFRRMLLSHVSGSPVQAARNLASGLALALGGEVIEGPSVDHCDPHLLDASTMLVVAVPLAQQDRRAAALEASLIRGCGTPVLFVPEEATPPVGGRTERA